MRRAVVSHTPHDMLTAGTLLVWLDAVVRAYGDDLPLSLRLSDGAVLPCLDAHVYTDEAHGRRVVLDAQERARVREALQERK